MNVAFQVGDGVENVRENRDRIKKLLGLSHLVGIRQVHGDKVFHVRTIPDSEEEAAGYDALITDVPNVGLMIQQADCQAVLLFDPERRAVGIVHSGWRGSVVNIIARTVDVMAEAFGSKPSDLLAAISPSLGPCCAEFVNFRTELPDSFHRYQVRPGYFDFWRISRDQLCEAGVHTSRISTAGICTVCDTDFFSYRREKLTGRCASVIAIRGPSRVVEGENN